MRIEMVRNRRSTHAMAVVFGAWMLLALAPASASAQVRGDFNGDGIGDLAIGAPFEGIVANRVIGGVITPTNITFAGSVTVIYGSAADGLSTGTAVTVPQLIHQNVDGVLDDVEERDQFGEALAAGDFNGDGFDDLVVSVRGDNAIQIFEGSGIGLDLADDRMIFGTDFVDNEGDPLVLKPGVVRGNFNGDGFDDIAIEAAEFAGVDLRANVIVMYGSQQFGIQFTGLDIFAFNNANAAGEIGVETIAMSLAAGDFSGDRADDLAVGLPFANVVNEAGAPVIDGGTVTILRGIPGTVQTGGIVLAGATGLTELNANLIPFIGEHFGATLAVGDFDGDRIDDLAVGAPEEDVVGLGGNFVSDGGLVAVFSRASTVHSFYTQLPLNQNPQLNDKFGAALASADFNGDGADDLAIGVPGDSVNNLTGAGSVTVLFGIRGVGLPRPASAGLPAIPGTLRLFTQATTDIADDPERNDHFGMTLTAGNFGRTLHDDLVIGVPDEDILVVVGGNLNQLETENRTDAGAVTVLYGSPTGPLPAGSQRWTQNTGGVPDGVEFGDRFGGALP